MISGNERQEVARRLRGPECKHKWKYQIMNDEKRNDVSNKLMDAAKCISKDDVACVLNDALHGEKKLSGINENCSTCCSVSLAELADLVKPSCDREALQWLDDQGGLDAVQARLMPEGMEWLVEAWPRYEDDAPLKLGDIALIDGEADMVEAVQLWIHGKPVIYGDGGSQQLERGERVKRPAPKVLDSEGVECNVGDAVWWVHNKTGNFRIIRIEQDGKCAIHDDDADEPCGMTVPSTELTHKRPVLDADGVEIRVGDTVWHVKTGREYVVVEPSYGDTVVVRLAKYDDAEGEQYAPDQLTHERPDSWERLEEDAREISHDVSWNLGNWSPSDFKEAGDNVLARIESLIPRAKALAERGQ